MVELRWLGRTVSGPTGAKYMMLDGTVLDGMSTETTMVLQYRTTIEWSHGQEQWSDWRDVPTVIQ